MRKVDIIGCGLFAIVLANRLANRFHVTIYEKRSHIGGNCYDYLDPQTGIRIHAYGPHILHIDDLSILEWISRFTAFNNYKHQVKAMHAGRVYDFPINLSTLNQYFGARLEPSHMEEFLRRQAQVIGGEANLEQKLVRMIGYDLYDAFFRHYTRKQWGRDAAHLPAHLIDRIPIHASYSTSYYKKRFNGIPSEGYAIMFKRMLSHPNISVRLNLEYKQRNKNNDTITVCTGAIDEYFNYCLGKLEYRSLSFVKNVLPMQDCQGVAVMNYPDADVAWTRICEPKHFYPEAEVFAMPCTAVIKEMPVEKGEPYYPIRDETNASLYERYREMAAAIPNLYFGGRLGSYHYYDMENCIVAAFELAEYLGC